MIHRATQTHLGRKGEAWARRFLEEKGYRTVATNYRCPLGEIDLVCRDGSALVFVEVKTRNTREQGLPEESVTPSKQRRLYRLAEWYLSEIGYSGEYPVRFDVVSILMSPGEDSPTVTLFRNAFRL